MTTILRGDDDFDTASPIPAGNFTAKAWVNFNGRNTVAIRADGNVSSITDANPGRYVVNFTNSFSSTSYCPTLGFGTNYNNDVQVILGNANHDPNMTTSVCGLIVVASTGYYDGDFCMLSAVE